MNKICKWEEDEDGLWETECKNLFEFIEGGPTDNSFKFCPYCGKGLDAIHRDYNEDVLAICWNSKNEMGGDK